MIGELVNNNKSFYLNSYHSTCIDSFDVTNPTCNFMILRLDGSRGMEVSEIIGEDQVDVMIIALVESQVNLFQIFILFAY